MAQGFPLILRPRMLDTNGALAVDWTITTYVGGSTTPLATYSDSALTSLNTNPVVVDASGFYRIYVAAGVIVKAVVKNELGALQWTDDPLEPQLDQAPAAAAATPVPTGGILAYGGAAAPTGYLLCAGALVSRATYAALFTAIGTTYGAGDGSTTFGLPDLRGKFPLGVAASGTGSTLGGTGGAIDHVHTGPSHTHTGPSHTHTGPSHTHTGPSHTHTIAGHTHTIAHTHTVPRDGWGGATNTPALGGRLSVGDAAGSGEEADAFQATVDITTSAASAADSGSTSLTTAAGGTGVTSADGTGLTGASGTGDTGASGTGNTGTANPPYQAVSFIIKT